MNRLNIAKDLHLTTDAATEVLAMLGRRGSGKTYLAQLLAEEMHRCKVQFVALDPVGIWYGLRIAADGKSPGLPIPVLGGLHGDIPLEAGGGALVADLVVDRGASMILDVSQFESDADKARFAQAFADRFFFRKKASPSAVHVFIEECQEFIPQNPQREETRMLHAFNRMVKIGRNFGIGMSMISQRPQEVNKKSLNLAEVLFAFQMTGPQERKTIQGWIADKGIDEDIGAELPKLEQGEPHVWSPAWLKISRRIRVGTKTTFDASSTPKVGKQAAASDLSPIDLDRLRTDMAATIEKAKADDPRLLRQKIAELTRQLSGRAPVTVEKAVEKRVEVPVIKAGVAKELESAFVRMLKLGKAQFGIEVRIEQHARQMSGAWQTVNEVCDATIKALQSVTSGKPLARAPVVPLTRTPQLDDRSRAIGAALDRVATMPDRGATLPPAERKFLTALAQQGRLLTRNQVAIFAGYSTASGHVDNTLGALRSKGYIAGGRDGIGHTDEGLAALGAFDPLPTGEDLRAYWIRELAPAASKFLTVLCDIYPSTIERDELATRAGYSPQSGHVDNTLGRLRSLDLATGGRASIRASKELFE